MPVTMKRVLADLKEMVAEQVAYRELLLEMTRRDLLLRYKQTVMGFAWAVFMPVANTAIFSVIFTRVAAIETTIPYPLFAYCGLLAWNFSAATLRSSVTSLTANGNLVTKIYFPREIFPLSSLLVALVDMLVGSVVLVALMAWYRVDVTATVALVPAVMAVHVLFTAAVALLLSMANLFYRDVKHIFEVAVVVWMFATSVLYPTAVVGGLAGRLLALNPMTHIIDAYRDVLLFGRWPATEGFALTALGSAVLLLASWLMFHRSEFEFAERV